MGGRVCWDCCRPRRAGLEFFHAVHDFDLAVRATPPPTPIPCVAIGGCSLNATATPITIRTANQIATTTMAAARLVGSAACQSCRPRAQFHGQINRDQLDHQLEYAGDPCC